ncbi:uncharacterized protein METZ01_LOCUS355916, partial [marine metagenome]
MVNPRLTPELAEVYHLKSPGFAFCEEQASIHCGAYLAQPKNWVSYECLWRDNSAAAASSTRTFASLCSWRKLAGNASE